MVELPLFWDMLDTFFSFQLSGSAFGETFSQARRMRPPAPSEWPFLF